MSGVRDNLSGGISRCSQISGLAVTVGFSTAGTIKASWTNPNDAKYKGVRIMYKTGSYPMSPTDGSVFYDSNDATPVSTITKNGFTDGTTYYLRAYAYTYKNATRLYTHTTTGAQASGTPVQIQGQEIFTSSREFTVPAGVNAIDVFLVGGGGGGNVNGYAGAGGGYTKTLKNLAVTPGSSISVVVGAGGAGTTVSTGLGGNGSASSITVGGTTHSANGGYGGGVYTTANAGYGGSGGGASDSGKTDGVSAMVPSGSHGGDGGSDGSNGYFGSLSAYNYMVSTNDSLASTRKPVLVPADRAYCKGQGSTTRAFGESSGTLYSGGGGSACDGNTSTIWYGAGGAGGGGKGGAYTTEATAGTANTGGGGGCGSTRGNSGAKTYGKDGGSGIVIIRWGY